MVAGMLRKLAVSMGKEVGHANNEDFAFLGHQGRRDLFEMPERRQERSCYLEHLRDVVRGQNNEHDVWGWKDPLSAFYIKELASCLRKPVFIVVTRDPGAVGQREHVEEGSLQASQLLEHIDVALKAYHRCLDIIRFFKRPTLLISYERALRSPISVGRAVAEMIGVEAPVGYDEWLQGYVRPDKLDGSVEHLATTAGAYQVFSSTSSIQSIIEESLKVRSRGFNLKTISSEPLRAAAEALYVRSVDALLSTKYEEGESWALHILGVYSELYPELADGPIGLLAHDMAGDCKGLMYPDVVCGALYVVGIANLLKASAQKALIHLRLAEATMANRIREFPFDSILSVGNYGSCVFHLAVSAKAMKRFDVFTFASDILVGGGREAIYRKIPDLKHWAARALDEVFST